MQSARGAFLYKTQRLSTVQQLLISAVQGSSLFESKYVNKVNMYKKMSLIIKAVFAEMAGKTSGSFPSAENPFV